MYCLIFQPRMHPNHHCTVHFRINNCQTVHLRSLSVFFILMIHTDNAHGKFYVYRSLPTRWLCNDFLQKSPKTKSNNTFTKPFITPNFCKWNLWKTRHSKTVNFFTFKVALIWDNMRVKVITTFESRKIIVSIQCIQDKFYFDLGDFWRKSLQCLLVGKLLWV